MSLTNTVDIINNRENSNFFLFAGPCVVENEKIPLKTAEKLKKITEDYNIPFVFKSSYRKANRSKWDSFTGIGDEKALGILGRVRNELHIPVITDIHDAREADLAAEYADILQIPAFLCRQTDILAAAARTGRTINIKKGQFLAPSSMQFAAEKVSKGGNDNILITDRGTMFGYGDIIVDYRGIPEMQTFGYPVILDITHSLQQPNQGSGVSGGRPERIETIAKAGIAVGADGLFMETHPDPSSAKSDGANMLHLDNADNLLKKLTELRNTVNKI